MSDEPQLPALKSASSRATARAKKLVQQLDDILVKHPKDVLPEEALAGLDGLDKSLNALKEKFDGLTQDMVRLYKVAEKPDDVDETLEAYDDICELLTMSFSKIQYARERRPPPEKIEPRREEYNRRPFGEYDFADPGAGRGKPPPVQELIKLPTHELPKFSGSYIEWPSFWDQFNVAIHGRTNLSGAHKLSYLKMCVSGEPLDLIKTLSIVDSNYESAIEILELRYEDSAMVLRELMDSILGAPSVQPGSLPALRKLLNTITEKVTGLRNAGVDSGYFFMTHIILRKLDPDTRRAWEMYSSETIRWKELRSKAGIQLEEDEKNAGTSKWDLEFGSLMEFLVERVQTWERAGRGITGRTQSVQSKGAHPAIVSKGPDIHRSSTPPPETFTASYASGPSGSSGPTNSAPKILQCLQCKTKEHFQLSRCPVFLKMDQKARHEACRQLNVCYNCLSPAHRSPACNSKFTCRTCKKKHHSLLHRQTSSAAAAVVSERIPPTSGPCVQIQIPDVVNAAATDSSFVGADRTQSVPPARRTQSVPLSRGGGAFLCTVQIPVINKQGGITTLRAMLDTGSQVEMISKEAADKLGWDIAGDTVSIRGVGGGSLKDSHGQVTFPILFPAGRKYKLTCHVMDDLVGELPVAKMPKSFLDKFSGYTLADPDFHKASKIDVLIGISFYNDFVLTERVQVDNMWLIHTVLGWAVTGRPSKQIVSKGTQSVFTAGFVATLTSIDGKLELAHDTDRYTPFPVTENGLIEFTKFWEVEELPGTGTKKPLTKEQRDCVDHYDATTTRDPDGRIRVTLPFRPGSDPLGHSRTQALRRFLSMERRLQECPKLREKYIDFMDEFISMGHLELVPDSELHENETHPPDPQCFYLPHHGVLKESSTTTKLRVVFDGSAKTSTGAAFNDQLMVGPRIQEEIFKILTRFRFKLIGMGGDVAKMYRQIALDLPSQDFHRLLWRKSPDDPIQVYRMTRVTYGVRSSSYHAIRALQEAAAFTSAETTQSALLRDFYVDDFLGGADSVQDALELRADLTQSLSKVQMPIRKMVMQLR